MHINGKLTCGGRKMCDMIMEVGILKFINCSNHGDNLDPITRSSFRNHRYRLYHARGRRQGGDGMGEKGEKACQEILIWYNDLHL